MIFNRYKNIIYIPVSRLVVPLHHFLNNYGTSRLSRRVGGYTRKRSGSMSSCVCVFRPVYNNRPVSRGIKPVLRPCGCSFFSNRVCSGRRNLCYPTAPFLYLVLAIYEQKQVKNLRAIPPFRKAEINRRPTIRNTIPVCVRAFQSESDLQLVIIRA